ncbi:MAG: RsmB/NOP family class I SAM-dependent RNA methyltransferase [Clostridia bacterium]|nr:RsmB/NOP family class I SAM-dependent RNA methyltransferase [Clostridia bacterium]
MVPRFLQEMLIEQYGEKITNKIIDGYSKQQYVTLRVNTIKSDINKIKQRLVQENIEFEEVDWSKNALIIKNVTEAEIRKLDIYINGEIYLQSLSSMLPPIILEPKERENILDMAAAPGGKTTQIAAMTGNKAFLTACEKNKIRAERLKYNLDKQGVTCVNVMLEDARKLSDYFSFDKILLDAPCSGSGTSNVIKDNFTKQLINNCIKVQECLLNKSLKLLKHGQEMVYSTCSILRQENEDILNMVLERANAEIVPIEVSKEIPLLPVNINGTICVCPTELYEGFFVAKIRKK